MRRFLVWVFSNTVLPALVACLVFIQAEAFLAWPSPLSIGVSAAFGAFVLFSPKKRLCFCQDTYRGFEVVQYLSRLLSIYLVPTLLMGAVYLTVVRAFKESGTELYPLGMFAVEARAFASSLAGGALAYLVLYYFFAGNKNFFIRGVNVLQLTLREAARITRRILPSWDPGLFFGGVWLPSEARSRHFVFIGATRSGKSMSIEMLCWPVLLMIGVVRDVRALIFDAKKDTLSKLSSLNLNCEVVTLNAFDQRSARWDIARDVNDYAASHAVSEVLIPIDEKASQKYFDEAARALLEGVMNVFIETRPLEWSFRDLIYVLRSQERLTKILELTEEGRELVLAYFSKEETAKDVMSTLANKTKAYRIIGALWDRAERKVSLTEWANGEFILVLGNSHKARAALRRINEALFLRAGQLLLEADDSTTRQTWLILDEVRQAGRFEILPDCLVEGASKGVTCVLGLQDIEGMRFVYDLRLANELIGQCGNVAVFRLVNPDTAEWASRVVGEYEAKEFSRSGTSGKFEENWREDTVRRQGVMASELIHGIPPTNPENGLTGYHLTPYVGVYRMTLPGNFVAKMIVPQGPEPNFIPRPDEHQKLRPWTREECLEFGISFDGPEKSQRRRSRLELLKGKKNEKEQPAQNPDQEPSPQQRREAP